MTLNLHARKSIFAPAIAGRISAAATRHVIAIALPIDPTNTIGIAREVRTNGRLRGSSSLHGSNENSARQLPRDYFLGKTDPLAGVPSERSPSGRRITALPRERRVPVHANHHAFRRRPRGVSEPSRGVTCPAR
jgi:hypothetical protein